MIREGKPIPSDAAGKMPQAVSMATNDPDVVALFAMGGMARNQLKPLSDIDFAVLLDEHLSRKQLFDQHLTLIGKLNSIFQTDEVDLVLLNSAPYRFVHEIIKTGRLLYCRSKHDLIDFNEHSQRLYLDFKYFKDQFDRTFLKGVGYIDG